MLAGRRKQQTAAGFSAALLFVYFALGTLGRTDDTPLGVSSVRAQSLQRTFPQRWAFFTKDPQSPALHLYKLRAGEWTEVELNRGLRAANGFGFRRSSRVLGRELGMLAGDLLPFEWFSCDDYVETCLDEPPTTAEATERIADLLDDCGEYAIVSATPKPWAWRDLDVPMPTTFAKFSVPCE